MHVRWPAAAVALALSMGGSIAEAARIHGSSGPETASLGAVIAIAVAGVLVAWVVRRAVPD